jgi:hypothetical protein
MGFSKGFSKGFIQRFALGFSAGGFTMLTPDPSWVVLANAAQARVWRRPRPGQPWEELACLSHPQSRQKGRALARDRAGHVERTEGSQRSSTALQPRLGATRKAQLQFAQELAQWLEGAAQQGRFAAWVLLASNPFMGELKAALPRGGAAWRRLWAAQALDLSPLPSAAVPARLREVLASLHPMA